MISSLKKGCMSVLVVVTHFTHPKQNLIQAVAGLPSLKQSLVFSICYVLFFKGELVFIKIFRVFH